MANLSISVNSFKRVDLVTVSGRIDSSNASELDAALKDLASKGRNQVVLELSEVGYMSSAGLRAIVSALRENKRANGDVRLACISDRVADVLELAGVESLFERFDDTTAAVGSY
jgi:anti-anti-sigma factor